MATRALFVLPRHGKSARRFHDVEAVRVVALHAVHLPFGHRMMLRQIELGVGFEMAGEARLRVAPRIHDEFSTAAPCCDVFAAGSVAGFAAGACVQGRTRAARTGWRMGTRRARPSSVQSRVWAGGKDPGVGGVAVHARRVARESGAGNLRRRRHLALDGRTRYQQRGRAQNRNAKKRPADATAMAHEERAQGLKVFPAEHRALVAQGLWVRQLRVCPPQQRRAPGNGFIRATRSRFRRLTHWRSHPVAPPGRGGARWRHRKAGRSPRRCG
jgi:hypothetical protein